MPRHGCAHLKSVPDCWFHVDVAVVTPQQLRIVWHDVSVVMHNLPLHHSAQIIAPVGNLRCLISDVTIQSMSLVRHALLK